MFIMCLICCKRRCTLQTLLGFLFSFYGGFRAMRYRVTRIGRERRVPSRNLIWSWTKECIWGSRSGTKCLDQSIYRLYVFNFKWCCKMEDVFQVLCGSRNEHHIPDWTLCIQYIYRPLGCINTFASLGSNLCAVWTVLTLRPTKSGS